MKPLLLSRKIALVCILAVANATLAFQAYCYEHPLNHQPAAAPGAEKKKQKNTDYLMALGYFGTGIVIASVVGLGFYYYHNFSSGPKKPAVFKVKPVPPSFFDIIHLASRETYGVNSQLNSIDGNLAAAESRLTFNVEEQTMREGNVHDAARAAAEKLSEDFPDCAGSHFVCVFQKGLKAARVALYDNTLQYTAYEGTAPGQFNLKDLKVVDSAIWLAK